MSLLIFITGLYKPSRLHRQSLALILFINVNQKKEKNIVLHISLPPTIISASEKKKNKKQTKKNKWYHTEICIFEKLIAGSFALAQLQTNVLYRFIFMTWTDVIEVLKKRAVLKCQLLLDTKAYYFLERLFSWMLERWKIENPSSRNCIFYGSWRCLPEDPEHDGILC